jgi:NADH-quinone oxidoreductase subunit L
LAGVPPLAGFWSKDEIIASAYEQMRGHGEGMAGVHGGVAGFVLVAALVTAFLTAFYMTRACSLTFFGRYRRAPIAGGAGGDDAHGHQTEPHESPRSMAWPLIVLAVLSVVGGWVGTPVRNLFAGWIHFEGAFHGEFQPLVAGVSIAVALAGIGLGWTMYARAPYGFSVRDPLERFGRLYRAAENRFYIDDLYLKAVVRPVQYGLSRIVYRHLDQGFIDRIVNAAGAGTVLAGRATRAVDERGVDGVVNGVGWITDRLGNVLRRTQTGNVQRYAAGLFIGVIVLAAVLFR